MKVGLVGANTAADEEFPEDGWEYWGVNNCMNDIDRVKFSRWFELHVIQGRGKDLTRRGQGHFGGGDYRRTVQEYLRGLNRLNIPVYMQQKNTIIRKSVVYPFERIIGRFGDYFGCSFAWMLALAIQEGADEIGFFGIALQGAEYYYQRPSVEFLMGIAVGKGTPLHISPSSNLTRGPWIYAYKEDFSIIDALYGPRMAAHGQEIITLMQQYMVRSLMVTKT